MREDLSSLIGPEWLTACPTGILVARGPQVLWASPALERMIHLAAGSLTSSHPTAAPLVQQLLESGGMVSIATGPDTKVWLRCTQAHLPDRSGVSLSLHFFQDVSGEVQAARERDALVQKVRELDLTDPVTGLSNRRALAHALNVQVSRSRRYHNPLSLALVRVEISGLHTRLPEGAICMVSHFLRDRLRWADEIGRHSYETFMLILPETGLEEAQRLLQQVRSEAYGLALPAPHQDLTLHLLVGIAQWRKGLDAGRLLVSAEAALAVPSEARIGAG